MWSSESPARFRWSLAVSLNCSCTSLSNIAFKRFSALLKNCFSNKTSKRHLQLMFRLKGFIPDARHFFHRSSSTWSVINEPLSMNMCKGVFPQRSFASASAPSLTKKFTCFQLCEKWSGVSPLSFLAFTAPPLRTSFLPIPIKSLLISFEMFAQ